MDSGLCLEERRGIGTGEDGKEVHTRLGSAQVDVLDRASQRLIRIKEIKKEIQIQIK